MVRDGYAPEGLAEAELPQSFWFVRLLEGALWIVQGQHEPESFVSSLILLGMLVLKGVVGRIPQDALG